MHTVTTADIILTARVTVAAAVWSAVVVRVARSLGRRWRSRGTSILP